MTGSHPQILLSFINTVDMGFPLFCFISCIPTSESLKYQNSHRISSPGSSLNLDLLLSVIRLIDKIPERLVRKRYAPTVQSPIPKRNARLRLTVARAPNNKLVPTPILSMIMAYILSSVARSSVDTRLFCSSICKGWNKLSATCSAMTPQTETAALSVYASPTQDRIATTCNTIPAILIPIFRVDQSEKPPRKPANVTAA